MKIPAEFIIPFPPNKSPRCLLGASEMKGRPVRRFRFSQQHHRKSDKNEFICLTPNFERSGLVVILRYFAKDTF
ncbi:hypothetical protein CEXT_638571 [Caerostris extrusa]|uniref:Uncharacterized protein n=1 Tax=Caerostris extrusa TaxID=172846 RepID=A0AAV4QXX5_CAEEX|nr:hypothetical protein CEXT_638571 [Caerostris extrusa]